MTAFIIIAAILGALLLGGGIALIVLLSKRKKPEKGKRIREKKQKNIKPKKRKQRKVEAPAFAEAPTPMGSGFASLESFHTLRKARAKWLWIFCAIVGVSVTLIGGFALYIFAKLTERFLAWYWYLVSGLAVGVALCGILLLCAYPTVKRLSKKLDDKHYMQERVQTMVEFSEENGAVVDLQRADAERRIAAIPLRKKGFWAAFRMVILPILAMAVTATALALPSKEPPEPEKPILPGEEIYESQLHQIRLLEALIANVDKSDLTEDIKPAYLTALQGILTLMQGGEATTAEIMAAVRGAMDIIVAVTTQDNSYNAFVAEIRELASKQLQRMGMALNDSGKAYVGVNGINIYDYASFGDKYSLLSAQISDKLTIFIGNMGAEISALVSKEEYVAWVNGYAAALQEVLDSASVTALSETDGVKGAIVTLQKELVSTVTAFDGGYVLDGVKALAVDDFKDLKSMTEEMTAQAYAYTMQQHVLHVLDRIFDCGMPEVNDGEGEGSPDDSTGGEEGDGDAVGGGQMQYPNKGEILNPATGEYVPYYELLTQYKAVVDELLDDPNLSEELKALINAYFDGLQTKD